ncbi:glycoside hydrolase family 18 protein [Mycena floridula]|nr:glycoside hydrolase family 18 protein [Mycena floridula]
MTPLSLLPLVLLAISSGLSGVFATEGMRRPDNFNSTANSFPIADDPTITVIQRRATGKVSIAYYTNWSPYPARNFPPQNIDPSQLTHIVYAFADVSSETGVIALSDSYADEQMHFATDSWSETGNNLYGCIKQMYLLKLANRNLKVLLSVAGWTYAQAGHFNFVTSASARTAFVTSAVSMIENYGFDGIDIDYEYPANSEQGQGFADLLTAMQKAFDDLATKKGDKYEISAAAYDYAGSWLTFSDNQSNLFGGARTGVSTDAAISYFTGAGATMSKITMGQSPDICLHYRVSTFENTGDLGQPFSGIGPGTVEAGIYNYNALPIAGATVFENTTDVSSYSYDSATKELVSYDTPNTVKLKAKYMNHRGFAGSMFWDLSTDKKGADSLIKVAQDVGAMEDTPNHINYPNSKWDNIRNNMSEGEGSTSTVVTPTTVPTTMYGPKKTL